MSPKEPEDPDTREYPEDGALDSLDPSLFDISRIDAQPAPGGDEAPPEHLGPYRIIEVLGEGGMGTVYLGEQEHPVRRRVAIKLIKAGPSASNELLSRFQAEQQALALMNHPNIAGEYEANVTDEGWPYLVMEHVKGAPITEYCDEHCLGTEDRLSLFVQVCDAVQHAHQKGIIHRDLKPSNVLMGELDGKPLPKVIDFGVAKAMEGGLTDRTMLTQEGNIIGTPAYMSPEQADGNMDVDTRADIYSLGILLYEMLVGALPFDFEKLGGLGFLSIQSVILEKEPVKPSTRLRELAKETTDKVVRSRSTDFISLIRRLRGDLDWISLKCMEKDRTRRYASASELVADIERYLTHEPVLAGPPSVLYRARKFALRHKASLIVAAAFLAFLGGLAGFAMYSAAARFRDSLDKVATAVEKRDLDAARKALGLLEISYRHRPEVAVVAETVGRLERDLKVKRSEELQRAGEADWEQFGRLSARKETLETTWAAAARDLSVWQPVWERGEELEAWHEISRIDKDISESYNSTVVALHRALEEAPDGSEQAHRVNEALEGVYWTRFGEAWRKGDVRLPASFFLSMLDSLGLGTYDDAQVETVTLSSDPPGAEVHCFRYENREERLVPLPFDPRLGRDDPEKGVLAETFLVVERVAAGSALPFVPGDRLLRVGDESVRLHGDVARALASVAADESVEVEVVREGETRKLSWTPFPAAKYENLPERSPLRPGRVVDFWSQMGLTFAGYPLEFLDGASLGETTADGVLAVTLPRGSYLFVLRREGFAPVRYPVSVPSETRRFEVRLLPEEDIPEGFVYIPKGPFSSGGDRDAYLSLDRQDVEVEGFFIGEHEVTLGEYLEYIRDIASRIDKDGRAEPLSDWDSPELEPYLSKEMKKLDDNDKRWIRVIPRYPGRDYIKKVDGKWQAGVNLDFPVLAVSVLASMEYALWLGRKHDGRWRFRLPRDPEWEKAARGVDRRTFVWGDYLLLTFCRSQKSTYPGMRRGPERIRLYPFDESVYGVRDLAGSMQEPTSELVEEFRLAVMRGGEWNTVDDRDFRIATRNRQRPENIYGTVGLRLAADLPAE